MPAVQHTGQVGVDRLPSSGELEEVGLLVAVALVALEVCDATADGGAAVDDGELVVAGGQGFAQGWPEAPRISEGDYKAAAPWSSALLNSLVRHSDRVEAACQAQLVNMIGSIRTEPDRPAWRQPNFDPFPHVANRAAGVVLQPQISAPTYLWARYGPVLPPRSQCSERRS